MITNLIVASLHGKYLRRRLAWFVSFYIWLAFAILVIVSTHKLLHWSRTRVAVLWYQQINRY